MAYKKKKLGIVHCIYSFVNNLKWKTDTNGNEGDPVFEQGSVGSNVKLT
jgi:hypothetical protein